MAFISIKKKRVITPEPFTHFCTKSERRFLTRIKKEFYVNEFGDLVSDQSFIAQADFDDRVELAKVMSRGEPNNGR